MSTAEGPRRSGWNLFWEERQPILLGLAFGSIISAFLPLVNKFLHVGGVWQSNPPNLDKAAILVAIGAILALALLRWPGPILLAWCKSSWRGINRSSFSLPSAATVLVLGLRNSLPLFWWCCFIPAVFALVTFCLHMLYRRSASIEVGSDETEDECRSIEDAWPERRERATYIANCIATDGKPTYAIYGEFGSGKSSMLNFVESSLRSLPAQRPIIIRFNGWLPGSQDNLADQLLHDISVECSKQCYVPHLHRSALKLAKALAKGVPHMSGLAEWLPQETQKDLIADLKNTLARLPERVIVLVDEIDRMRKEELFTLLKLIRGFSCLPRLSFVCALERDHVERMIRDEYGALDHTFYHKFFVESFQLPKLVDSFLESETHDTLVAVFDRHGWFKDDAQARNDYSNEIHEHWKKIFAPLCTNAREIGRLANSVRTQAWSLIGEVNPFDLTLVASLRYFAPAALNLIWTCRDTLCAHDIDGGVANPERVYESKVISYFEQEKSLLSDAALREQVSRIRAVLFSRLEEIMEDQDDDSRKRVNTSVRYFDLNKGGAKTKRLRSKFYFPAYFQDTLPVMIFPEKDMSRIFDELKRSDELQGARFILLELEKMAESAEKRLNFLDKLSDNAIRSLDLDRCTWVANVLVSCSSNVDEQTSETENNQIARFVTCVSDELSLTRKPNVRLDFIRKCVRASRSDGVAVKIFQWTTIGRPFPQNITSVQRGVQPVPKEDLEGAYLERMMESYGPGVGLSQVDLNLSHWQAFGEWGRMLEKSVWAGDREVQRDFWRRYILSPEKMADFSRFVLAPFLLNIQTPGHHAYIVEDILPKEEIQKLAQRHPPYHDQFALSYVRELLGKDAIPELLSSGSTMSNYIDGAGVTDAQSTIR